MLIAQERGLLLSQYYSPEEYEAPLQNWSIIQDQRGIMYFGNSNCVLEYDGNEWRKIYVPNYSNVRALAIDSSNQIYVGAYNEFGVLVPDEKGTLSYKSLTHLIDSSHIDFGDIWDIHCVKDEVFFLTDNYFFRYKNNTFKYWENTHERFYLSFDIDHEIYIQEIGIGLLKVKGDSLIQVKNGDFFSHKRIHSILPYEDKLLICTRNKGLYLFDYKGKDKQITPLSEISEKGKILSNYFIENTFYHGTTISENQFALSTIAGNVLIVDKNWNVLDNIDHETTGIVSPAQYLYYEKGKALWMALSNGICRVDILSPFRYWNDEKGIHSTVSDVAQLNDILYATTGSGVYYINRNPDKLDYSVSNFNRVKGKFEQAWGFLYFILPGESYKKTEELIYGSDSVYNPTSDKTLLLVATSTGLFQIIDNKSKKISDYKAIFDIYQYKKDPSNIFLALSNGIAHISYKNGQWIDHGMKFDISDKIRELNEDSVGNLWASASYKGVYRVKNPLQKDKSEITLYDTDQGLPSVQGIGFANYNSNLLFISYDGYLTFDAKKDSFTTFEIPRHEQDYSDLDADSLCWYEFYDNIISNIYVTTFSDTTQWFSSVDRTYRYSPMNKKKYLEVKPALVRKVTSGDSVIFDGTNYKTIKNGKDTIFNKQIISDPVIKLGNILDFKDNSLTFHFSLPFYEHESTTEYSYFLEGNDKVWSPWTNETKKEYTNLKEGEYTFKVKARNLYRIESPVSEFKFTVLAPWYRTFAAILGYIVLGILLIIVIVRLYTYRLIKEKDKLEKIVIERTQEILMQKEEILVQAEHLKEANERISAKNEELEKQKWEITNQALKLKKANVELIKLSKVASETDNAIAIFDKDGNMEWVNEGFTRLYGYTYEEYAKERSINLLDGSDNPNIREAVKSCLRDKKSVVYEFNTTNKEGHEIWAQTTLTHVVDKNGDTINLIAIDSDITKLKQAEKEILKQKQEIEEQRDKLAISNATKNKFFRIIAHDLRNPISTLAGSTNLIFNDFEEYEKAQTKAFIGELNRLSQTTFNLLENLLDWSSSQMGDMKYSPKTIHIKSLTDENIELIKRRVDTKQIRLIIKVSDNCKAFADEDMVKTIIRNLLSNAVKFTPENGSIEINCLDKGDFITYSVKDSGIGIRKEDQKKLFRIDTHHSTPGLSNEKGSGLGLILCKEFVEKNGGEIHIVSEPNKGTTIEFTLRKKVS